MMRPMDCRFPSDPFCVCDPCTTAKADARVVATWATIVAQLS